MTRSTRSFTGSRHRWPAIECQSEGGTIKDGKTRSFIEKNALHPDGARQVVVPLRHKETRAGESTPGAVILEYTAIWEELLAAVRGDLYVVILAGIVVVLFATLFGLRIAKRIARPLQDLKMSLERVAAQEYSTRVSVTSKDEIGMLGSAFNRMAERILERTEQLSQANSLLQEREEGLRHAQRIAKLAHVITRPDGSFESWSETLPQLVGVDTAQMPQSTRAWSDIVHPDDRAMFRDRALEAGIKGTRTASSIGCSGPTAPGSMSGKPSSRSKGRPIRTAEFGGLARCRTLPSKSGRRSTYDA
jgi:HAMP domain-containing protein